MRKLSGKQRSYALSLADRLGRAEASRISRRVLIDPVRFRPLDAFEEQRDIRRPWHKPLLLDSLSPSEATKLIDALLDEAGRSGRRRNNRARR